jgi:hypothetical protein
MTFYVTKGTLIVPAAYGGGTVNIVIIQEPSKRDRFRNLFVRLQWEGVVESANGTTRRTFQYKLSCLRPSHMPGQQTRETAVMTVNDTGLCGQLKELGVIPPTANRVQLISSTVLTKILHVVKLDDLATEVRRLAAAMSTSPPLDCPGTGSSLEPYVYNMSVPFMQTLPPFVARPYTAVELKMRFGLLYMHGRKEMQDLPVWIPVQHEFRLFAKWLRQIVQLDRGTAALEKETTDDYQETASQYLGFLQKFFGLPDKVMSLQLFTNHIYLFHYISYSKQRSNSVQSVINRISKARQTLNWLKHQGNPAADSEKVGRGMQTGHISRRRCSNAGCTIWRGVHW